MFERDLTYEECGLEIRFLQFYQRIQRVIHGYRNAQFRAEPGNVAVQRIISVRLLRAMSCAVEERVPLICLPIRKAPAIAACGS